MPLKIVAADVHLLPLRTRMPFKYGIATMTVAPQAFVRATIEVAGRRESGVAADILPPKWFTKDPVRDLADEVAEMLAVIDHAVEVAQGLDAPTPFDAWWTIQSAQAEWGKALSLPPLLYHFGATLVERAVIEAWCRLQGEPFHRLLVTNRLGIDLGRMHAELAGWQPSEFLPAAPRQTVIARHTVGMADPLTDDEIPPDERLDDGLPQSLAACIDAYGLQHFKIKLSGDADRDCERLERIAAILAGPTSGNYAVSLDGNEHFRSFDEFHRYWNVLFRRPTLGPLVGGNLLWVEQPWHRDVALDPAILSGLDGWEVRPQIILDESDADLDSLPRALALGYAGTSHKNCKGVFRGIASACLLQHRRRKYSPPAMIHSGEDLANIGPVALLQDLAVAGALGILSIERNGHHYFAGLSQFPPAVHEQVLNSHGDLYHATRGGWPSLTIQGGRLDLGSIHTAPFGVGFALDVDRFIPRRDWTAAML